MGYNHRRIKRDKIKVGRCLQNIGGDRIMKRNEMIKAIREKTGIKEAIKCDFIVDSINSVTRELKVSLLEVVEDKTIDEGLTAYEIKAIDNKVNKWGLIYLIIEGDNSILINEFPYWEYERGQP